MSDVVLENAELRLALKPNVGGTITSVVHKPSGLSVLGEVPWQAVDAPLATTGARDEPEWLTRYSGGWPLLFPNGGDACTDGGVFHGFHGEASISPWSCERHGSAVKLHRHFEIVPVTMQRDITLEGSTVVVREHLAHVGDHPVEVMWGHHPTFGSDLLAGSFEITAGACDLTVDPAYDPPSNPLSPGAGGRWPMAPGKSGPVDMQEPGTPRASLVYLHGFDQPWAAIRRRDNAIAVILTWDGALFPCAWLWYELEATAEMPWQGRTRLIGIEPNTTACAAGLSTARQQGANLLRLQPGQTIQTELRLQVFRPDGPIRGPTSQPKQ